LCPKGLRIRKETERNAEVSKGRSSNLRKQARKTYAATARMTKDRTATDREARNLVSEKRQKTARTSNEKGSGEAMDRPEEGLETRATTNELEDQDNLMEEILDSENLKRAYKSVVKNSGAPGIDGVTTKDLKSYLAANWHQARTELRSGTYKPKPIKRVEIPKPDGGVRKLGIPTVLDRFIQQAIMQVLQSKWDKTFSPHSYGFRPGRSAHQAVEKAKEYIRAGNRIVVDIDLEKFFDRVNHDILMSRVAKRIHDKRVLKVLRAFLNAGVLENGLVQPTEEGVPQGGPLSPILSNLLLDELDQELEKRRLHFVRYADDCNIYVASERAGERVKESITKFLARRLRLKVNEEKSAVGKPSKRKFLGFSFVLGAEPKIRLSESSKLRFQRRIRELTRPTKGRSLEQVIQSLRRYLIGWRGYYRICQTPSIFTKLDKWIRRRLRCYQWRLWKRGTTRYSELTKRGITPLTAAGVAGSPRGPWRISGSPPLQHALPNAYLAALGLPSLVASN
jgi:RNA-directed DNA polymerase